jgi:hypothetical protein
MQSNERGRAASGAHSVARFVAIFAGVPLIAILALSAPDRALAACGSTKPAGVHSTTGSGVHTATSKPPTSGSGGGSGTLGCANGSSASALHGLPTAASGKVVEGVAATAHMTTRTATTRTTNRTTNSGAQLRGVKPPHA